MIQWELQSPGRVVEKITTPASRLQIIYRAGKWRLEHGRWMINAPSHITRKAIGAFASLAEAKAHAEKVREAL